MVSFFSKSFFFCFLVFSDVSYNLLSRKDLRNHISYMSQSPYLFETTIGENIRIANPNATKTEIIQAARRAGVFDFAKSSKIKSPE